ncbi:MAG TPA: SIMPL domain-containing protein, partial [Anaerolineales bacterium]|nr:SIMPL domain-containing protein [Anaerolineales bacterium]
HNVLQNMSNQNSTGNGSKLKALAIVAVLAVGALAAIFAASQAHSIASAQTDDEDDERSTVSTTGIATTKVDPDKVSLNIGVETDGANATDAITKNSELMDAVIAALRNAGVTDEEMSTGYFSVYPTYSYAPCIVKEEPAENSTESGSTDPSTGIARPDIYPYPDRQPTGVITGYKATNSLAVTLDASADVGAVIDAAVEAGANTVNGAYFFVSSERQEEIKDGLIGDALSSARARADAAAGAVNMTVTGVKSIHLQDVYFPVFDQRASPEGFAAATPILPGEQEISLTVQVTYFIG